MKEIRGNLFEPSTYSIQIPPTRGFIPLNIIPDAICISTNGFVKKDGRAVMGRGCAKELKSKWPEADLALGIRINQYGNKTQTLPYVTFYNGLTNKGTQFVAVPVKPKNVMFNGYNAVEHMKHRFQQGETIPGWASKANLALIKQSAKELVEMTNNLHWSTVVLPRLGCGAGELDWNIHVKDILADILDDRFYVITY